MRKRHDYRNQFKNMTKDQLEKSLLYHKDQLLKWIGIDSKQESKELNCVTYIESKLESVKR